jgi:hypothetical protein
MQDDSLKDDVNDLSLFLVDVRPEIVQFLDLGDPLHVPLKT